MKPNEIDEDRHANTYDQGVKFHIRIDVKAGFAPENIAQYVEHMCVLFGTYARYALFVNSRKLKIGSMR